MLINACCLEGVIGLTRRDGSDGSESRGVSGAGAALLVAWKHAAADLRVGASVM